MSRSGARAIAAGAIALFCLLEVFVRRPALMTDDLSGWRQADTQAIARNFAFVELNPLMPRIDWGGDGPGYVESELQLYAAAIAVVMRATGESELPGQLLSLACIALVAWITFRELARRFGAGPALAALALLLCARGPVFFAVAIQPDPLALLAFTVGFFAFLRFIEHQRRRDLVVAAAFTALAGLVKPTTLELGVVQVALVALIKPALLRRRNVWLAWAAVIAVVVAFLLHARHLHFVYGNTFGTISGGDSKFPAPRHLVMPRLWLDLARMTIVWGVGWSGVVAIALLAWRRRLGAVEAALGLGALALGLVALRYTSHKFGLHYHLPSALVGAWLVAHALAAWREVPAGRPRWWPAVAPVAIVVAGLFGLAGTVRALRAVEPEPETPIGFALARLARPGDLVVVRARAAPARDDFWDTANNYQDPRVFYLARVRGWVLPSDLLGAAPVADLVPRGARFYVETGPPTPDPPLRDWLSAHAALVVERPEGRIHALGPLGAR